MSEQDNALEAIAETKRLLAKQAVAKTLGRRHAALENGSKCSFTRM